MSTSIPPLMDASSQHTAQEKQNPFGHGLAWACEWPAGSLCTDGSKAGTGEEGQSAHKLTSTGPSGLGGAGLAIHAESASVTKGGAYRNRVLC